MFYAFFAYGNAFSGVGKAGTKGLGLGTRGLRCSEPVRREPRIGH
jgi:hypothetical protein